MVDFHLNYLDNTQLHWDQPLLWHTSSLTVRGLLHQRRKPRLCAGPTECWLWSPALQRSCTTGRCVASLGVEQPGQDGVRDESAGGEDQRLQEHSASPASLSSQTMLHHRAQSQCHHQYHHQCPPATHPRHSLRMRRDNWSVTGVCLMTVMMVETIPTRRSISVQSATNSSPTPSVSRLAIVFTPERNLTSVNLATRPSLTDPTMWSTGRPRVTRTRWSRVGVWSSPARTEQWEVGQEWD